MDKNILLNFFLGSICIVFGIFFGIMIGFFLAYKWLGNLLQFKIKEANISNPSLDEKKYYWK